MAKRDYERQTRMISFKGMAGAALVIVLAVVLLVLALWLLDSEWLVHLNAYWLIGGFVILLLGALAGAFWRGRRCAGSGATTQGAKAAGIHALRATLLVVGILALLLMFGAYLH